LDEGLGFPGYRVYKHEIDEQRKHVTLWIRRKRGNQNLRCPGCGRRVGEIHEVIERTVRDLPCFEYTTTVIVELYRLRCPNCGVKTEQMPQLPSKAPYRIKAAKFPVSKSLETYNFLDMPTEQEAGDRPGAVRVDEVTGRKSRQVFARQLALARACMSRSLSTSPPPV
jgi:transposase